MYRESSFTLIELLIVIGILAVLATVAVIVLNPQELIKQARDTQRMADLATLNKALAVYQSSGQVSLGSATTVYVSIPSNQTNCSDLGLPTLPSGYTYACVPSSTLRNVNGQGWIPLSFSSVSYGTPLEKLPTDPINSTSTRNYYTYVPGGSWELATAMESTKYKMGGGGDKTSSDGGQYPGLYEEGTNLTLLPIDYADPSLVGYWKFDEGGGSTAYDSSGRGNTGNLVNSPTWQAMGCKAGQCISFLGANDSVNAGRAASLSMGTGSPFTVIAWLYPTQANSGFFLLKNGEYGLQWRGATSTLACYDNVYHYSNQNSWNLNQWYHVVMVQTGSGISLYVNGSLDSSASSAYAPNLVSADLIMGKGPSYYGWLDDVRIYNRALSAAEVMAIYNATK